MGLCSSAGVVELRPPWACGVYKRRRWPYCTVAPPVRIRRCAAGTDGGDFFELVSGPRLAARASPTTRTPPILAPQLTLTPAPCVAPTSRMQLGRMARLAAAVALVAIVAAVVTSPAPVAAAKKQPLSKLCPPSRCQLRTAYEKKLEAARTMLSKQYGVSRAASRTLPVLTLFDSARCRSGGKVVQPVHICWEVEPAVAFNKALARTRAIIVKAEAVRTGNCAQCPRSTFLFAGVCCSPDCNLIRRIEGRNASNETLKACCAVNNRKCLVLKKDVKKPTKQPAPKKTNKKTSKKSSSKKK